jgi:hypothetical protein
MLRPCLEPRGAHRRNLAGAVALALLVACHEAAREPERENRPLSPASTVERFSFALPPDYVKVELRGEGSESLMAPKGARVTHPGKTFRIEAGDDFALDVALESPALSEFKAAPGVARVLTDPDTGVFKSGQAGYSFVVVRELVPEWDESQRQRFACGSAGGAVSEGAIRADGRSFSKAATQSMVAACRSLELPPLE